MTTHETLHDTSPSAETSNNSKEPLGAWFAKVRTQSGLTQQDVARHLRLNPILVRAIENDDHAALGPPVFVRGYLSRYAQLLDMPEQRVLERYSTYSEATRPLPPLQVVHSGSNQTRSLDLRGLIYVFVIIIAIWLTIQNMENMNPRQWFASWSNGDQQTVIVPEDLDAPIQADTNPVQQTHYPFQEKSQKQPREKSVAVDSKPKPSSETAVETTATTPKAAVVASATAPSPTTTPAAPAGAETTTVTPASSPTSPSPPSNTESTLQTSARDTNTTTAKPGMVPLTVAFSAECWLEIKDAQGKVLARGLMKANTRRTLSGKPPFAFILGNAPAASITLGTKQIDRAIYVPRRGTVSRFTLGK